MVSYELIVIAIVANYYVLSINLLEDHKVEYDNLISPLIMHTRWATCGPKTDINSHPLTDWTQSFSIVHNGIIDNYIELRNMLKQKGITFKTETDTEVIVNLISYYYEENRDALKLVAVDNGNGPVLPSKETVLADTYAPLSRPVFCYVNEKAVVKPEIVAFFNFYL